MRAVRRLGAASLALATALAAGPAPAAPGDEVVVLLHGLFRSERAMAPLARHLEQAGWTTLSIDYPSTREPIETLAARVRREIVERAPAAATVHAVTHSLGGVLLRQLMARDPLPRFGRAVLLAPPSGGSEVVDALDAWGLAWSLGPAGRALGTGPDSAPRRLPPPGFELGVIAGSASFNPLSSWLIPGPDDGRVSVDSARIEGMRDFLVVERTHTFIMRGDEVKRQVVHFLRSGAFVRQGVEDAGAGR